MHKSCNPKFPELDTPAALAKFASPLLVFEFVLAKLLAGKFIPLASKVDFNVPEVNTIPLSINNPLARPFENRPEAKLGQFNVGFV